MAHTILPELGPHRSTVRDLLVWPWLTGSIPVLQHFQRHMTDWLAGDSQFQVLETHSLGAVGSGLGGDLASASFSPSAPVLDSEGGLRASVNGISLFLILQATRAGGWAGEHACLFLPLSAPLLEVTFSCPSAGRGQGTSQRDACSQAGRPLR